MAELMEGGLRRRVCELLELRVACSGLLLASGDSQSGKLDTVHGFGESRYKPRVEFDPIDPAAGTEIPMNCDQAFDYLTSPAGRQDLDLQSHLAQCPRCRDVADMLGVALDLFDDAAEPPQTSEFRSAENGIARPVTASQPWLRQTRRRAIRQDASRIATFLVLVAVFSVGIVQLGHGDAGTRELVSVSLPESCLRDSGEVSHKKQAHASNTLIAGCVACHLDSETTASLQPAQHGHAVQFVQNCVACHFDLANSPELATVETALPTLADSARAVTGRGICLF